MADHSEYIRLYRHYEQLLDDNRSNATFRFNLAHRFRRTSHNLTEREYLGILSLFLNKSVSLSFISNEHSLTPDEYEKLCKIAIEHDPQNIQYVKEKMLPQDDISRVYKELCIKAVKLYMEQNKTTDRGKLDYALNTLVKDIELRKQIRDDMNATTKLASFANSTMRTVEDAVGGDTMLAETLVLMLSPHLRREI